MDSRTALFFGLGFVGVIGIGYIVYFDYKRRNDPVFRKKIKKNKKRFAKLRKAAEEDARNKLTTFAREALDEVGKEDFPDTVEAKEKFFMDQVAKGETLFAGGEAGYKSAAICFYKALKVYPSPLELIMIYQKTIPEAVFNLVYTMMSLEIKKKQEEYWEIFPSKEMNVKIQPVEIANNSKTSGEKEKLIRRGIFATKDFKPGDVIYEEKPLVSALDPNLEGGDFCGYCLREIKEKTIEDEEDLFQPVYCSEKCRNTAAVEYSTILFKKSTTSHTDKESRLVDLIKGDNVKYPLMIARFFARMVYEETEKVAHKIEDDYSTFDHIEKLRYLELPATQRELREIEILKSLLASKVPGIEEFISEERYMMLKGKLLYNSYGINTAKEYNKSINESKEEIMRSSSNSQITGAGFYHVTSYFAHSCDPNTQITFPSENHVLSVVATKPIKAGDELKLSYIKIGDRSTQSRREELSKKWKFLCLCPKCAEDDPGEDEDDESNWVDEDEATDHQAFKDSGNSSLDAGVITPSQKIIVEDEADKSLTTPSPNPPEIVVENEGDTSEVINLAIPERKVPVIGLLIITSILGVLVRITFTDLITYPGAPVFPLIGPQFLGCVIMGFCLAKKATMLERYLPLYTGLTTGLCGSITTFSSWNIAITQSLLNYNGPQRSAIDNPISALSYIIITIGMSVSGLKFGEHLAGFFVPTKNKTNNIKVVHTIIPTKANLYQLSLLDWICTILGFGSLIAVITISIFWHSQRRVLLSTIFGPLGTLIRWQLARLNAFNLSFPFGTFAANISGTFIFALLFMLSNGEAEITILSNPSAYRYAIISLISAQLAMLAVIGIYDWTVTLESTCG
ncbi:5594_t:CDS:10 [Ambispora leptoticha]|uniref:5594_t:CDS:1 n=1 Tax=Ambispora leptoticha TaxID=144679 RepID=A0A9N9GFZ8_9GLOM|nr:5594_t:CDS:10 [Ambispora leptoticha]